MSICFFILCLYHYPFPEVTNFFGDKVITYFNISTSLSPFLGLPGGTVVKNSLANAGNARDRGSIPITGWGDPLGQEMVTCSIILASKILWTEEPGRLQSMDSQSRT